MHMTINIATLHCAHIANICMAVTILFHLLILENSNSNYEGVNRADNSAAEQLVLAQHTHPHCDIYSIQL